MAREIDTHELNDLLGALMQPTALAELGVLVGCLVLAWAICRVLRGKVPVTGSVWFGERIVDGVLFPVVALALAFAARFFMAGALKIAVFKVAIPILLSLVVIRLSVRVLQITFPHGPLGARCWSAASRGWRGSRWRCGSPACCPCCWMPWTRCAGRWAARASRCAT